MWRPCKKAMKTMVEITFFVVVFFPDTSVCVCVYSRSHMKRGACSEAHLNASAARELIPVVDWPS